MNRKTTTRFPMNLIDEHMYVAQSPKWRSQTQSVQYLNNNLMRSSTRYEIGCQLVLLVISNRNSHTGFLLVPMVTLNYLERYSSPYFALLYRMLSCRPITSQWLKTDLYIVCRISFSTFAKTDPPCSAVSLR